MSKLDQVLTLAQDHNWAIEQAYGNTWITVPLRGFKDQMAHFKQMGFNMLTDVVGLDYLNYPQAKPERFCVVYELLSLPGYQGGDGSRFFVRVFLHEQHPEVPTVTDLWNGANWLEREVFDLLGFVFTNHPDLRKILTPDDMEGYPLRKDFPLGETPTLFKDGRFIDPAAFRAGLSGNSDGLTGWRGGSRRGFQDVVDEVQQASKEKP